MKKKSLFLMISYILLNSTFLAAQIETNQLMEFRGSPFLGFHGHTRLVEDVLQRCNQIGINWISVPINYQFRLDSLDYKLLTDLEILKNGIELAHEYDIKIQLFPKIVQPKEISRHEFLDLLRQDFDTFLKNMEKVTIACAQFADSAKADMYYAFWELYQFVSINENALQALAWLDYIVPKIRELYSGPVIIAERIENLKRWDLSLDYSKFDCIGINDYIAGYGGVGYSSYIDENGVRWEGVDSYASYRENLRTVADVILELKNTYPDKKIFHSVVECDVFDGIFIMEKTKKNSEIRAKLWRIFLEEMTGIIDGAFFLEVFLEEWYDVQKVLYEFFRQEWCMFECDSIPARTIWPDTAANTYYWVDSKNQIFYGDFYESSDSILTVVPDSCCDNNLIYIREQHEWDSEDFAFIGRSIEYDPSKGLAVACRFKGVSNEIESDNIMGLRIGVKKSESTDLDLSIQINNDGEIHFHGITQDPIQFQNPSAWHIIRVTLSGNLDNQRLKVYMDENNLPILDVSPIPWEISLNEFPNSFVAFGDIDSSSTTEGYVDWFIWSITSSDSPDQLLLPIWLNDETGKTTYIQQTVNNSLPNGIQLYKSYPNPFNSRSKIRYRINKNAHVKLQVFSITGQHLRTLVDRHQSPGFYDSVWDGQCENHIAVSSGIYLYRLDVEGNIKTMKTILLR